MCISDFSNCELVALASSLAIAISNECSQEELIILAGSKENISKINNLLIENKIEGFSDNKIDEDNNNKIKIIPGRSFIRF